MTNELTPNWVPKTGLQLRLAGIHFDAVRVCGVHGEAVLHHLAELTDGRPGPVVRETSGCRWTYFLLAPGESAEHDWPPGARRFGRPGQDEYIGVPRRTATHTRSAGAAAPRRSASSSTRNCCTEC
uniref:DNA primase/polymerase bifunctional N-terminal domain-containing protein n=1 Tax=Streptomyces sp. NBC_01393 TaxID=2903851 RepID=A0AAU3HWZ9_9ACTN